MQKRMRTSIKLKIEKFEEEGREYFVATSDEFQGLVAEGETIDKTIEIAEDVARILIELEKDRKGNHANLRTMPKNFDKLERGL
jgi:predicted RNase H-like HicB family nuclease